MGKPKKESGRHSEAFEYYLALGKDRSLEKVAERFGTSSRAVHNWSSEFGWTNRVMAREREVSAAVADSAKSEAIKMVERQLKIVRAIQGKFVVKLQANKVDVGANDFMAAAKYESHLTGFQPEGTGASAEDIAEFLRGLLYVLQTKVPESCPHCKTLLTTKAELSSEFLRLGEHYAAEAAKTPPMS